MMAARLLCCLPGLSFLRLLEVSECLVLWGNIEIRCKAPNLYIGALCGG